MALIVAPDEGFDALVSVAEADAYATKMGLAAWMGDDTVKEPAIRRATQYLLAHYEIQSQYLDPVHANVQAACCEMAVKALVGSIYTDVKSEVVTSKTVGPISVTYADRDKNGGQVRYSIVDDLLRGLLSSMSGMVKLVRA